MAIALTYRCGSDPSGPNPDTLALEVKNTVDALVGKQLPAPNMNAAQSLERYSGIHGNDERTREIEPEIRLVLRDQCCRGCLLTHWYVTEVGETLATQQPLGDVLRRDAAATREIREAGGRCFGWRLSPRRCRGADEARGAS